jgi:cobalt-zinc-cadmium efflux system protein
MEDALGWLAVLVASVVMLLVNHPLTWLLDPLISLGITAWVLWNVWRNLRDTFRILLQGVPAEVDAHSLASEILAIPGVEGVHDLHVWSQDGESHVMTLHVVTSDDLAPADLEPIRKAVRDIGRHHGAHHVTIEFETNSCGFCEYDDELGIKN